MNRFSLSFDDYLLVVFCSIILLLTYLVDMSINKYLSVGLIVLIFIKAIREKSISRTYFDVRNLLFYLIVVLVGFVHVIKYDQIGVGLLSLFVFLVSADFIKSLKINEPIIHRVIVGVSILILSVITIEAAAGWKYTYKTGAGGILSAFMLLAGFVICFVSGHRILKWMSYLFGLLLVIFSIRGPILSAVIFVVFARSFRVATYAKAGFGLLVLFLTLYVIAPESRVFDLHMSGRWIHWVMIWDEFEWRSFLFGMGDAAAANVLIDRGLEETMAAPHNEILRIFYDYGLAGLLLLGLAVSKFYSTVADYKTAYVFAIMVPFVFDNAFSYFFSFMFIFMVSAILSGGMKGRLGHGFANRG